ncbi:hypothetical protein F8M41_016464 [Gigaspora margarita]|uniref:Uncharacterized protein n=1 Tax=Gigaspora margarita TaxID=4874 RepID=A0A8H4APB4_GIGMA|nr:hypothetical protein F8M41_016464 [Gigaspora margarita]
MILFYRNRKKKQIIFLVSFCILIFNFHIYIKTNFCGEHVILERKDTCQLPELPDLLSDYKIFIDIRRGPGIGHIVYDERTNTQYVNVTGCPNESTFKYHFKTMGPIWATWNQNKDGLLELRENYVFLQCNDKSNASMIRKEIKKVDAKYNEKLEYPIHSQSLVDDVVTILLDGEAREKFKQEFVRLMDFFQNAEKYTDGTHKWFSMEKFNVLDFNSVTNKPFIYSGQSKQKLESKQYGNWIWDAFEEQEFITGHTDGSCGGFVNPLDWDPGDATYFYMQEKLRDGYKRIQPGFHYYPTDSICDNLSMLKNFGSSCQFLNGTNETILMQGFTFGSGPYCIGDKTISQHTLDWIEEFLKIYSGKKRFISATFLDTHVNGHWHTALEDDLLNLINKMIVGNKITGEKPLLSKNSVIIIHSDHGIHYGDEYSFYEGYIHHKQPTMMMLLPTQLLKSHPNFEAALEFNKYILSTHMDLHQTLLHLAYGGYGDKYMPKVLTSNLNDYFEYNQYMNNFLANSSFPKINNQSSHIVKTDAQIYGNSFLIPMNEQRTCESLNIPTEFCPCIKFTNLDYNNNEHKEIIDTVISKGIRIINNFLIENNFDLVCKTFSLEPTNNSNNVSITFKNGIASFSPKMYRVTVKVKEYDSLLTISTHHDLVWSANFFDISQDTLFMEEWDKCRPKLRKVLGELADKAEDDNEKIVRNFCFCTN